MSIAHDAHDADEQSLADVVQRLWERFGDRVELATIIATVRHCRRELDIRAGPSTPDSVEYLAAQRLADVGDYLSDHPSARSPHRVRPVRETRMKPH